MARPTARATRIARLPLDRFQTSRQVGGITTATLNDGPGTGSRVAFVNTGAGLRYTVALDRGADIVDATFNQHSLAYLTPCGIKPPEQAYLVGEEWLSGWPGGLVTTCGPVHFGHPRTEGDRQTSLHGHYSHQPSRVEMVVQPEPHRDRHEMLVSAVTKQSRAYGPNVEIRRTIQSALGANLIHVYDQTTNRDNKPTPHGLLYHVNTGWPLLDRGAHMVLSGSVRHWPDAIQEVACPRDVDDYKRIPGPSKRYLGRSRGFICTPRGDRAGRAHVGLINDKLNLALELEFALAELPRVLVWQHFAPGMYVMGIEPMVGTPFGHDVEPDQVIALQPDQTRRTELTLRVHADAKAIARLARHDKPLKDAGKIERA